MSNNISDNVLGTTVMQQIIASTIGALATSFISTPLDVVKIRMQAQQKNFQNRKFFVYSNGLMEHLCYCSNGARPGHVHGPNGVTIPFDPKMMKWYKRPIPGHFKGTFDALIKIGRSEGVLSLWSGLPPTLLMSISATVVYFIAYDNSRVYLWSVCGTDHQPFWIPLACGGLARLISATVISPLELVRTKMQSKKHSYVEIVHAVKQSVKYEGVSSLWRGLAPTLLRDVPFSSLYWLTYESMKQKFDQRQPTLRFSILAGAMSGTVAAVATLPFDVVKTHRQIELGERDLVDPKQRASQPLRGTYPILKNIFHQSGFTGLFAGIVPRVVKVAPSCAIMITCYEHGKKFFAKRNSEKTNKIEMT